MIPVIIGVVVLFVILFGLRYLRIGAIPEHGGLDWTALVGYMKYASEALSPGGSIYLWIGDSKSSIHLQKPRFQNEENDLYLRFRSGSFSRSSLVDIAAASDEAGLDFHVFKTPKLRRMREVRVAIDVTGATGIARSKKVFQVLAHQVAPDQPISIRVQCAGPFLPGFTPEDGNIIEHPISHRLGFRLGRIVGAVINQIK